MTKVWHEATLTRGRNLVVPHHNSISFEEKLRIVSLVASIKHSPSDKVYVRSTGWSQG